MECIRSGSHITFQVDSKKHAIQNDCVCTVTIGVFARTTRLLKVLDGHLPGRVPEASHNRERVLQ